MEEEKKVHRVVVYENEWAPVRRFARRLYQLKNCGKAHLEKTQKYFKELEEQSSSTFAKGVTSTRKTVTKIVQSYPPLVLGIVGIFVGVTSKKCKNLIYLTKII